MHVTLIKQKRRERRSKVKWTDAFEQRQIKTSFILVQLEFGNRASFIWETGCWGWENMVMSFSHLSAEETRKPRIIITGSQASACHILRIFQSSFHLKNLSDFFFLFGLLYIHRNAGRQNSVIVPPSLDYKIFRNVKTQYHPSKSQN